MRKACHVPDRLHSPARAGSCARARRQQQGARARLAPLDGVAAAQAAGVLVQQVRQAPARLVELAHQRVQARRVVHRVHAHDRARERVLHRAAHQLQTHAPPHARATRAGGAYKAPDAAGHWNVAAHGRHFSWQVGLHMSGCNDRCLCLMQTGEPLSSHIKGGPRVGAHLLDAHTSLQGVLSFRPGIDGHIGQTALVVVVAPLTCIEAACTLSQRRPQPSHHTCMRADDCLEPPRCAPNRQAVLQHRYAPHRLP